MRDDYDFAMIGSGFDGSITGGRPVQAGHSFCILERGEKIVE
jgi:choline dehydrogenase-like flavoprotein